MQRTGLAMHATAAALSLLAATAAHAGGHFDVDDAGTLAPGECQYELWAGRLRGDAAASFQHVGPSCRVGPVELGLNADRSVAGSGTDLFLGPQLKWTFFGKGADAPLSAALSAGMNFDVRHGGRAGGQLVVPVIWQATRHLEFDINFGGDWTTGRGDRTGRIGAGGQWTLNETFALVVERNRAFSLWTSRIGARINLTPHASLDLSVARTGPQGDRSVIVGLNRVFGSQ